MSLLQLGVQGCPPPSHQPPWRRGRGLFLKDFNFIPERLVGGVSLQFPSVSVVWFCFPEDPRRSLWCLGQGKW